jgi:hypothetical protein
MKPIRLPAHPLSYINKRGFTVSAVEQAIRDREVLRASARALIRTRRLTRTQRDAIFRELRTERLRPEPDEVQVFGSELRKREKKFE